MCAYTYHLYIHTFVCMDTYMHLCIYVRKGVFMYGDTFNRGLYLDRLKFMYIMSQSNRCISV